MRVLVTGSRVWKDRHAVWAALDDVLIEARAQHGTGPILTVVHGKAPGADAWAHAWAAAHDPIVTAEPHEADWRMGKQAGHWRNQHMVNLGADLVLAFFQPGATNAGTGRLADVAVVRGGVVTAPLPPEERHDPRQVLIDVLLRHQKRDIKSCDCGTWGSDHGHLGQSHAKHVADRALAALAAAGLTVVEVARTETQYGRDGGVMPLPYGPRLPADWQQSDWVIRDIYYGPWRPVGEGGTDAD